MKPRHALQLLLPSPFGSAQGTTSREQRSVTTRYLNLFLFLFCALVFNYTEAQTIQITSTCTADTTGIPIEVVPSLDHRIDISFSSSILSGQSDFRVGIGAEQGDESALSRLFSTSESGTFDDGCSLTNNGGTLNLCLGVYSGMGDFHVTVTPVLSDGSDGSPQSFASYSY